MDAVRTGKASADAVDEAARRMLRLILRVTADHDEGELRTARHRSIARRAAEEGTVLLKNEGRLLPLDRAAIRTLAVIGPNADVARIQGGGSSRVAPGGRETPLSALRRFLGEAASVTYAQGVDSEPHPRQAQARDFSPGADRSEPGLTTEYFTAAAGGEPTRRAVEQAFWKRFSENVAEGAAQDFAALRWTGFFWPSKSGRHEFSLRGLGEGRVMLDRQVLVDASTPVVEDREDLGGRVRPRRTAGVELEAGRPYAIQVDYRRAAGGDEFMSLGVRHPSGTLDEAVSLAREADAVVLVVGSASATEGEGYDRADLGLPGAQDALVEAVLAANPRTVVVLNTGSPFTLPWAERAPALMQMWLPGEAGPEALAHVLFGESAPSGRLPVTFPRRIEDTPAFSFYGEDLAASYGEGLYVGYRHYDRADVAPLFPFGHGLGYTEFRYADIQAPGVTAVDDVVEVIVTLENIGARAGQETVQLYVRPLAPRLERPLKELKAFVKVEAKAGETVEARLVLTPRAFAAFDSEAARWVSDPGEYELLIGASSADIRLRAPLRRL